MIFSRDRQTTLAQPVTFEGIGVHSNVGVVMEIEPAAVNVGFQFARRLTSGAIIGPVSASHEHISATSLRTVLDLDGDHCVEMVEHVLSALSGLGVDNALIFVNSAECPIMDGSAKTYVDAILDVGIVPQAEQRKFLRVKRSIIVRHNDAFAALEPHNGRTFDIEIDYESDVIGRQRMIYDWTPRSYCTDISPARTFGFLRDVDTMRANGFALGSSFENSIAIDENRILNKGGLRFDDEFVRHKLLDAMGDLALAGLPIFGMFRSYKGGHQMNSLVLQALFSTEDNYEIVSYDALPVEFEELSDLPKELRRSRPNLRVI